MFPDRLASISISWNEPGKISLVVSSSDFGEQETLALSVPLVIGSQLGILNIRFAIILCANCLDYLATSNGTILAIPPILRGVRVDLHKKGKSVVETFYPEIINSTDETGEYHEAILRFYNNYILYVHDNINNELNELLRQSLLMSVYFYLDKALPKRVGRRDFSLDNYHKDVQLTMLQFCESIYPHWGSLVSVSQFMKTLEKANKQYKIIRDRLL